MKTVQTTLLTATLLALSSLAHAGPTCTDVPQAQWIAEQTFQDQLKRDGYEIMKFKVTSGQCYEIYGKDKSGQKVEIYFNPVDGKIVKEKREG